MKYIDLSHEITDNMSTHSYDSPVRLFQEKFLDKDKFNGFRLEAGMHIGTHIDCASHLTDSKLRMSDIPIEKFCGNGCLIDVRGKAIIKATDIDEKLIQKDSIVLVFTGYDQFYGQDNYYNAHPVIDESLANLLIEKEIKMIGMDIFSPDKCPFPVHNLFFKNDILILENLTNLHSLTEINNFKIYAFPLKINAEAAPARVIACY